MMTCKHCGDAIAAWTCEACKPLPVSSRIVDECRECHAELAHDVITNQNIHIVGHEGPWNTQGIDCDVDANKRADN